MPKAEQVSEGKRHTKTQGEVLQMKTLSKKRVAPSPSFLLLQRESRPKADRLIALRRGLESSPRRGKRFCGMAFAPGAPRCSRENCGLFRVFPRSPRKHADLIFAPLRGLKGHLEEERGILGTPFASSAPRCSREHCGLFRVFPRCRGSTHLA